MRLALEIALARGAGRLSRLAGRGGGTTPPTIQAGSRPSSRRTYATIAAVVVFPCAPPTTIDGCADTSSARNSARERPSARPR